MTEKEQRIVDAAWRLVERHGYRKVTMGDIAEASGMSRPSLYAAFDSKEAVFIAFMRQQCQAYEAETRARLAHIAELQARLECVFDVWIIEPFASVVGSEIGRDLLANVSDYVPAAVDDLYARFEAWLVVVLEPETTPYQRLSAIDLAHIMMLATKGLKASTDTLPEFRRMMGGLILMTVATIHSGQTHERA